MTPPPVHLAPDNLTGRRRTLRRQAAAARCADRPPPHAAPTGRRRTLRRQAAGFARGVVDLSSVQASIRAGIGHASHADSWRIREEILGGVVFRPPAAPEPRRCR